MSVCDKINCGYYYKTEEDDFPRCHFEDDGWPAPCEQEDDFETPDIDEDLTYEKE